MHFDLVSFAIGVAFIPLLSGALEVFAVRGFLGRWLRVHDDGRR